jgi:GNAT superfamily N-acetyltransferase
MSISLREFTPQDTADIVNVHNANYPLRLRTVEAFVEADKTRNPKCKARRWVACEGGRIAGYGAYDQEISDYHPHRFYVQFAVLPEHQRRGIGAALYEQVLSALQAHDPRVLRADAYSTHPEGLRFLEERGFREAWRETPVQLDVAAFDPSPYAGTEAALRVEGFEIRTLRDLEGDPDRNRKVYNLYWQIHDTLPREESEVSRMDFDDWAAWTLDENQVPPDCYFIVMHDGEYVGLKELSVDMSDKTVLQGGLLGVKPEYRRRGIALALHVRANAYARDHGYRLIQSSTGAFHAPMQSLFTKLGYVHLYDWYQMERRL